MATTCNVMAAAGVRSSSAQMRAQPARSAHLLMLAPKRVASRQAVRVFASGNGTALAVKEAQGKSIDKVEKQYLSERAAQVNKHFETALGKLGAMGMWGCSTCWWDVLVCQPKVQNRSTAPKIIANRAETLQLGWVATGVARRSSHTPWLEVLEGAVS
mgnify:CR=1 FL=1